LFQAQDQDRIYYRVDIAGGRLLAGYADIPPVPAANTEFPAYADGTMRGTAMRVVWLEQPVIGSPAATLARVAVAETVNARRVLTHKLWLQSVVPQVLIVLLTMVLMGFALDRGLRPMQSLRDRILARQPGALEPVDVPHLSTELQSLVDALNDYIHRLHAYVEAHDVFIQNAAHQLRTPFALLNTQLNYAARYTDPVERAESLEAAQKTLRAATRLVNQLLALSSAQALDSVLPGDNVAHGVLQAIAQDVLETLAVQAQARQIDLGAEWPEQPPLAVAARLLVVREMLLNLVDNAIRYTPPGGRVTVAITTQENQARVAVSDNGPGIAPELRERAFARFFRLNAHDSQGSGLGLAIVREYALKMGASVQMSDAPGGQGLCVTLCLPLVPGPLV